MTLSEGRDIAAIIIALEYFLFSFIPLAIAYYAVKGMRRLLPAARRWLQVSYEWTVRAGYFVDNAMRWLLAPILFLSGLAAGIRAGAAALRRR